ncbi:hypothetical protein ABVT39_014753 [Epinephelus coioides]
MASGLRALCSHRLLGPWSSEVSCGLPSCELTFYLLTPPSSFSSLDPKASRRNLPLPLLLLLLLESRLTASGCKSQTALKNVEEECLMSPEAIKKEVLIILPDLISS